MRGKIEAEFANIGEQSLKNIARPLRVYRIGLSPALVLLVAPPITLPLPDKPSIAVLPRKGGVLDLRKRIRRRDEATASRRTFVASMTLAVPERLHKTVSSQYRALRVVSARA
jgi:hypothetical protein